MIEKRNLLLISVLWGAQFVEFFTKSTLASLLAPENLPLLSKSYNITIFVISRAAEIKAIEDSDAYRALSPYVTFQMADALSTIDNDDKFNIHHYQWSRIRKHAQSVRAIIWHLPPDAIYSNNVGATIARELERGKKAIIWWHFRGPTTMLPGLEEEFGAGPMLSIPPRQLVQRCFDFYHPLQRAYSVDSPNFAMHHPEMIHWPVADNAILVRMLLSHVWIYDAAEVPMTWNHCIADEQNLADACFLTDSDDFFAMAITPTDHNYDWFDTPAQATAFDAGRWWAAHTGPSNDFVAESRILIHATDIPAQAWAEAIAQSDEFINMARIVRDLG